MDEDVVSVKVKLSVQDYCELQMIYTKKIGTLLPIFIPVVVVIFRLISSEQMSPIAINVNIAITLIISIGLFFYFPRQIKKTWIQQYIDNKSIQKEHCFLINSEGLECSSESSFSRYSWSELYAYIEAKDGFLILISANQYHYIPKKSFENDENKINIVRFYLQNLPVFKGESKSINGVKIYLSILVILLVLIILVSIIPS